LWGSAARVTALPSSSVTVVGKGAGVAVGAVVTAAVEAAVGATVGAVVAPLVAQPATSRRARTNADTAAR
jgi:hypothetical protein